MSTLKGIQHVVVIGGPHEPERYAYLQAWIRAQGFDPSYCEFFSPTYKNNLDPRLVDKYCGERKWNTGQISLSINFIMAFERVAAQPFERVLFLESDVLFDSDFALRFDRAMNEMLRMDPEFDYLSIGKGTGARPVGPMKANRHVYPATETRCTDSMVWSVAAIRKVLTTLKKFTWPIDFELNHQIRAHGLRCFWLEPPIVVQGTSCGRYKSEINQSPRLG